MPPAGSEPALMTAPLICVKPVVGLLDDQVIGLVEYQKLKSSSLPVGGVTVSCELASPVILLSLTLTQYVNDAIPRSATLSLSGSGGGSLMEAIVLVPPSPFAHSTVVARLDELKLNESFAPELRNPSTL